LTRRLVPSSVPLQAVWHLAPVGIDMKDAFSLFEHFNCGQALPQRWRMKRDAACYLPPFGALRPTALRLRGPAVCGGADPSSKVSNVLMACSILAPGDAAARRGAGARLIGARPPRSADRYASRSSMYITSASREPLSAG